MKTILTTAAAIALAAAFSAPAVAQDANEQVAKTHSGGQCAFSQAMLAAADDGKQQQMEETKTKIDLLIENALAASREDKLAQSPVKMSKSSPDS